jgi:copper homeostasis protein
LTAIDALPEIGRLLRNCARGPIIMPGSGISPTSVGLLLADLLPFGLSEVHMSGGEWVSGTAEWKKAGMGMGVTEERAWDIWKSSSEKISGVRRVLDSI